jgi:MarR family transcriptional regulator, organic hydroperoxide resistance regulator
MINVSNGDKRKEMISQLYTLGQVESTETALFHQTAAAKSGLRITEMKTISTLLLEGSKTAGQLAKRLYLTTGAVTNVIDRLERRNFVRRIPDAEDRRKVIVTLNHDKICELDTMYVSMGRAFEKLLNTYSTDELEFLVQFYRASIEITKSEIAKLSER